MQTITFTKIPPTRKKTLLEQLAQASPSVQRISLTHCGLSLLPPLPSFSSIKQLVLSSNKFTATSLLPLLQEAKGLSVLELANNLTLGTEVESLLQLPSLSQLSRLDLSNTSLKGTLSLPQKDLSVLKVARNVTLTTLSLQSLSLKQLDVSETGLFGSLTTINANLPKTLHKLSISETRLKPDLVIPQLKVLVWDRVAVNSQCLLAISLQAGLRKLSLANCWQQQKGLQFKSNIEQLKIDGIKSTDLSWINWPSLNTLFASSLPDPAQLIKLLLAADFKLKTAILENSSLHQEAINLILSCKALKNCECLSLRANMPCAKIGGYPKQLKRLSLPIAGQVFPLPDGLEQLLLQFDLFTKRDEHFNKACTLSDCELDYGIGEEELAQLRSLKHLKKLGGIQLQGYQQASGLEGLIEEDWDV